MLHHLLKTKQYEKQTTTKNNLGLSLVKMEERKLPQEKFRMVIVRNIQRCLSCREKEKKTGIKHDGYTGSEL